MREHFGDYFICKQTIYRTFTNYFEEGFLYGKALYKINADNRISKISVDEQIFQSVEIEKISKILLSRLPENLTNECEYIVGRLKSIGIKNIELTGSLLLASYGYKKSDNIINTKSDLDFIIRGEEDSNILKERFSKLYDKNFKTYESEIEDLYNRRSITSKIKTTMDTIKNYELYKPIGTINGLHVNITPTYILSNYRNSDYFSDHGFIETKVEIIDDSHANSIPGYYGIKTMTEGLNIEKLRSNVFYFCLGENLIGKKFKTRGRLISEYDEAKKKTEYCLELDSRWGVKNLFMILD